MSRLTWTDPAPLEVQRPRLPWWTMCTRKLLWAASPVILVVVLVTALVFLGRRVWRYPLLVIGGTALAGLGIGYSWWAPIELLTAWPSGVGCGPGRTPAPFTGPWCGKCVRSGAASWSTPGCGNGRCCFQT